MHPRWSWVCPRLASHPRCHCIDVVRMTAVHGVARASTADFDAFIHALLVLVVVQVTLIARVGQSRRRQCKDTERGYWYEAVSTTRSNRDDQTQKLQVNRTSVGALRVLSAHRLRGRHQQRYGRYRDDKPHHRSLKIG